MLTPATALTSDDLKAAILPRPPMASPDCTLGDAIAQLAQAASPKPAPQASTAAQTMTATGCLLVVAAGRLIGLLTEPDVVRLIAQGIDLKVPLRQVIAPDPVSLSITDLTSFKAAEDLFQRHSIRVLPIVEETGQVLGVLTWESLCQQLRFVDLAPNSPFSGAEATTSLHERQASEEFFRNRFEQADITQRKTTEQSLKQQRDFSQLMAEITSSFVDVQRDKSEQRFKRAMLDAPYPIMIHAEDGEILQINQAWTQLSGYTPSDIPTIAAWTENAYGHRQEIVNVQIDQLFAADHPVNDGEFTIQTKIGNERIWDFSSAPLGQLPDGRRYALSIAVDITDRKLAEAERLKSKKTRLELKLLETILDVILAGYWDWHIPTQQNYLSPGLKRMFGYEDNELPHGPNTWQQLIFPEDLPVALESFQHHVESGGRQPYSAEVRYRHKNGSTVWVLCSGQVIEWDDAGQPQYVVGCHVDITQLKQAELKLQKSDAHLKTAQRIGKIGSWEFDVNTGQIIWSDEVFRIFQRDPAVGPPNYEELLQLYLPEDAAKHHQIVQTALALGQPYNLECRGWRPDGTLFCIQARGEPVFDHNGTLTHLVGTILDITDRKLVEEQILQTTAQLKTSNQELEAFAYSVSHDLRSPLRAIDGFSQALLEDYGHLFDPDGLDFFHRIRSNVSRMGTLIDDLLRLSRVSRAEMQYGKVNLSTLVTEALTNLQTTAPERQVEVTIAPNLIVFADATLMAIVINNLIENAWKFTSHHPVAHIEFGLQPGDHEAIYFVRDDGAGFDMAYGDMLFGVFQRLHNANEFPGTGIGLATVQRVIHRHGGRVWAEATIEQGATLFFTLPAATLLGD